MRSRMEKYYTEKPRYNRTTKNANLYKEVYRSYAELENLPIADNTNEIDMKDLEKIVKANNERHMEPKEKYTQELPRKKEEDQREYDINKILEKVKNNNRKKEENQTVISPNYKFLSTLESQELPVTKIKESYENYTNQSLENSRNLKDEDDEIYMTRELKFKEKQLEVTREINLMKKEESSPLDLLEDLKPDGNTFVMDPIKPDKDSIFATEENRSQTVSQAKEESLEITPLKKQDDKKKEKSQEIPAIDNDFYTSSYKFSKRDFIDDDDDFFDKPKKSHGILKVLILLIAIFALTTIIYYFISKYGMGI